MPVVITPTADFGPPVTSTDLVLTATPGAFGTVLVVDFTKVPATSGMRTVSVVRTVAGVATTVRGLDMIPAPGGITVGIDAEHPLSTPVTFRATGFDETGAVVKRSTAVMLTAPAHRNRAWLRCLNVPSLSVQLTGESYPQWQRETPSGVFRPPDRVDPVVRQGKRQFGTGTLTLQALTANEVITLDRLLDAGGPYLLQADATNRVTRPDVYLAALSDGFNQPTGDAEYYSLPLSVVQIKRPGTKDSRVSLPGHTIGDLGARYATFGDYPSPLLSLLTA